MSSKNEMKDFFLKIWNKKPRYCQSCGKWLGREIKTIFFDHLLEKSKYPQFALEEENIYLCCMTCHEKKTNGFPTEKHKEAIEQAKIKFEI